MCRSVSEQHVLFIDHLRNINFLHTLVNSHTLQLETIRSVIKQMRKTFLKLHTLFGLNESLKLHVIFAHYVEYFEKTGHTLLRYTDEVTEAVYIVNFECSKKGTNSRETIKAVKVMQMPSTSV